MYKHLNFVVNTLFACISLLRNEAYAWYVQFALVTYFALDVIVQRGRPDICIHHILFTIITVMYHSDIPYLYNILLIEWSTVPLLLYKNYKLPTKELFVVSWILLRLVYLPYLLYDEISKGNVITNVISSGVYSLFFYWTSKIIDTKCNSPFAYSSILLYFIPLNILIYTNELNIYKYGLIYVHSLVSFLFHSLPQYRKILCPIDTSIILFSSLNGLQFNNVRMNVLISLSYIPVKFKFESLELHSIFSFIGIITHIVRLRAIGMFIFAILGYLDIRPLIVEKRRKHVFIWHAFISTVLGISLTKL